MRDNHQPCPLLGVSDELTFSTACRCVTCAISCANTPESKVSSSTRSTSPEYTKISFDGSANALIFGYTDDMGSQYRHSLSERAATHPFNHIDIPILPIQINQRISGIRPERHKAIHRRRTRRNIPASPLPLMNHPRELGPPDGRRGRPGSAVDEGFLFFLQCCDQCRGDACDACNARVRGGEDGVGFLRDDFVESDSQMSCAEDKAWTREPTCVAPMPFLRLPS